MTTLEERIAEALGEVFDAEPFHTLTAADLARAVVAVLPTADVSDEAIEGALSVDLSAFPDFGAINRALVSNVRALLDAQAAAHAAEIVDMADEVEQFVSDSEEYIQGCRDSASIIRSHLTRLVRPTTSEGDTE